MDTSSQDSYTAKLTDGPLEGKTISTSFLESGDPQPKLRIPVDSGAKHYVYTRGAGLEFEGDGAGGERPTAVDYRFIETAFD